MVFRPHSQYPPSFRLLGIGSCAKFFAMSSSMPGVTFATSPLTATSALASSWMPRRRVEGRLQGRASVRASRQQQEEQPRPRLAAGRAMQLVAAALGLATWRRDRLEILRREGLQVDVLRRRSAASRLRAERKLRMPRQGGIFESVAAAFRTAVAFVEGAATGPLAAAASEAAATCGSVLSAVFPLTTPAVADHELTEDDDQASVSWPRRTRNFLKAGAVYQNPYMSLWNDNHLPISSVLRLFEEDKFRLEIKHLDSKGGGSEGWIAFEGSYGLALVPDKPGRLIIVLKSDNPAGAFTYDEHVFSRAANFAFSCMKRLGSALLGAFYLEVDIESDVVFVEARATPLRIFWQTCVGLEPTAEEELWKPVLAEGNIGLAPDRASKPVAGALAVA
mmetsp:Transcript_123996/g.396779  ORF Transcript_123996/g.396779 Transcript_123996/m.396779 type:complete len:392 (-) Transcript_123996:487-1662(-)